MEIITEEDYQKALQRLEEIFDAEPNTSEGLELEELSKSIIDWENKMYPI
jgi:HTH-type transcriptional regulator/antitoxin HigA